MDTLKNKNFEHFDYLCRYSHVPYYYDQLKDREIFGIGMPMLKDTEYVTHKVEPKDTLDSLALKYYNNPTYWWIIAYYNNILDSLTPLAANFTIIKIPNISSISFGNIRG